MLVDVERTWEQRGILMRIKDVLDGENFPGKYESRHFVVSSSPLGVFAVSVRSITKLSAACDKIQKIFPLEVYSVQACFSVFYVCVSVKVKVSSKIVTKFNYFSKKKNIRKLLSTSFFLWKNKSTVEVQFFVHVTNYRYL